MPFRRSLKVSMLIIALLVVSALLALGGLRLGGDRVIPCSARRGLDAIFGGQFGHVDGPPGGGGCIVPTTRAWALALVLGLAPLGLGATVAIARRSMRISGGRAAGDSR
jgi:hypothetical protein